MTSSVDEDARRQFMELQEQMIATSKQISVIKAQLDSNVRQIKRSELTLKELNQLTGDHKCYKTVGRAFLYRPTSEIKLGLQKDADALKDDVITLGKSQERFRKQLKENEDNLRELISTHKVF
eukprot:Sdes_comp20662_c0_seq1m15982